MLSDLTPQDDHERPQTSARQAVAPPQPHQTLLIVLLLISTIAAGFLSVSNLRKTSQNQTLELENQRLEEQVRQAMAEESSQAPETKDLAKAESQETTKPAEEKPPNSTPLSDAAAATLTAAEFGADGFEPTNLKVQQAVVVELNDGRLQKVLLEIPVLYQSRQLRMDAQLGRELRQIRDQVVNHQSKMRNLRSEGAMLLNKWNRFLYKTTPSPALRVDSITLPSNQGPQAPNRFSKPLEKPDIQTSKQQ